MATTTTAPRLVVCGGNGFLGSRICKSAVSRGWTVTSISRSGTPDWKLATGTPTPPEWAAKVTWAKGNILIPASYRQHLVGATAVVHSMGILLEADYKGVISGKESPIAGLRKAFDPSVGRAHNLREEGDSAQLSYETMNRDSAITLAEEALSATNTVKTFLYVSAAAGSFALPSRYISTKREAEAGIQKLSENGQKFRPLFLRPGFLYDSSRTVTMPLAGLMGVTSAVDGLVGGRLKGMLGAAAYKPLKVDVVADAAVEAIADESVTGVVDVDEIERLSGKVWRAGML
ncbi:uncharacterized protein H6S33_007715 [Morchella sextelata]|uniref:uncharacterized protein n=1 Tax=Morchella sextelata TaxID=1174677 RepID=UPI001D03B979|nr:uncharacterized protein H6S33_007715 [Morchella sextelata]KAH0603393.1 hypothetical protein H6S33_007715 [Morchella sextelata]